MTDFWSRSVTHSVLGHDLLFSFEGHVPKKMKNSFCTIRVHGAIMDDCGMSIGICALGSLELYSRSITLRLLA